MLSLCKRKNSRVQYKNRKRGKKEKRKISNVIYEQIGGTDGECAPYFLDAKTISNIEISNVRYKLLPDDFGDGPYTEFAWYGFVYANKVNNLTVDHCTFDFDTRIECSDITVLKNYFPQDTSYENVTISNIVFNNASKEKITDIRIASVWYGSWLTTKSYVNRMKVNNITVNGGVQNFYPFLTCFGNGTGISNSSVSNITVNGDVDLLSGFCGNFSGSKVTNCSVENMKVTGAVNQMEGFGHVDRTGVIIENFAVKNITVGKLTGKNPSFSGFIGGTTWQDAEGEGDSWDGTAWVTLKNVDIDISDKKLTSPYFGTFFDNRTDKSDVSDNEKTKIVADTACSYQDPNNLFLNGKNVFLGATQLLNINGFKATRVGEDCIIYNLNGGKNNAKNPVTYSKTKSTSLYSPTRKGYEFKGWYSDKKLTKIITAVPKGKSGDYNVYAKWAKKKYTITYVLNSGENSSKNPTSYTVTSSDKALSNPTRKGYTFKGWYTDKNYKNAITKIKKGSTGNLTLYAKWSKTKNTITYQLNGGKNNSKNPTYYTYSTTGNITLENPIQKGYTFKG